MPRLARCKSSLKNKNVKEVFLGNSIHLRDLATDFAVINYSEPY